MGQSNSDSLFYVLQLVSIHLNTIANHSWQDLQFLRVSRQRPEASLGRAGHLVSCCQAAPALWWALVWSLFGRWSCHSVDMFPICWTCPNLRHLNAIYNVKILHTYIHTYVYNMHMYTYTCMYVYISIYIFTEYTCICVYIYIHVLISMYIFLYIQFYK